MKIDPTRDHVQEEILKVLRLIESDLRQIERHLRELPVALRNQRLWSNGIHRGDDESD